MICPHCQSRDVTRAARNLPKKLRAPQQKDESLFRAYRCLECRRIFLTEETPVQAEIEMQMLSLTNGSEQMQLDLE